MHAMLQFYSKPLEYAALSTTTTTSYTIIVLMNV